MKSSRSRQKAQGLTLVEVVCILFVLFVLALVLLPAFARTHGKPRRINCTNNLKQVGLAFKIWADDNNDKYPMAVSVTNGGAMEPVMKGNAILAFQVISNELSTPKILFCPEDAHPRPATNFEFDLTADKVSYFAGVDAVETHPQALLSGDDNFIINNMPAQSGLLVLSSNAPVTWSPSRHKRTGYFFSERIGYLLSADGSVDSTTKSQLNDWLRSSNRVPARIAIP